MKKINLIKKLLIGAPLLGGTIMTSACGQQKIDLWNLSTWGNKEKDIIVKSILTSATTFGGSNSWSAYVSFHNFSYDLKKAFQTINSLSNVGTIVGGVSGNNIVWTYVSSDKPKDGAILSAIFKKGLLLSFKGSGEIFVGEMTINFKGSI